MPDPPPTDEKESLKALQRYEILDTAPEREFDGITLLASHICGTRRGLTSRPAEFLRGHVQSDKSIPSSNRNPPPSNIARALNLRAASLPSTVTGHFKTSQPGSNQPATLRCCIHIRILDASKGAFPFFHNFSSQPPRPTMMKLFGP